MSTRATYQFQKSEYCPGMTFYIHYDGYPEGTAQYFLNMLENDSRGSLADRFHRANDLAEFTFGHDSHSDTEYQYTVRQCKGAWKVRVFDVNAERVIFNGLIEEFINTYVEADDPRLPIVDMKPQTTLLKEFSDHLAYTVKWAISGCTGNGFSALQNCIKVSQSLIAARTSETVLVNLQAIATWYENRFRNHDSNDSNPFAVVTAANQILDALNIEGDRFTGGTPPVALEVETIVLTDDEVQEIQEEEAIEEIETLVVTEIPPYCYDISIDTVKRATREVAAIV